MRIDILTLFPEMFSGPFSTSIIGRAQEKGLVTIRTIDIRDYTHDKHRQVDDYPYGGGSGMVMKPEPLFEAIEDLEGSPHVILVTPQGKVFNQEMARRLSRLEHLAIVCGHYEGIDERVRISCIDEEISVGDFVLTGGEIPAMLITDAVVRLIPGVLGSPEATREESFADGLLEYPQYTRPRVYRGMSVPEVLLSGNHARIARWRRKEAIRRTLKRRPDLLKKASLSDLDRELLSEIEAEEESDFPKGREADLNECDG